MQIFSITFALSFNYSTLITLSRRGRRMGLPRCCLLLFVTDINTPAQSLKFQDEYQRLRGGRRSLPAHVRSIECIRSVILRAISTADALCLCLSSSNLRLEEFRILVNPLQLRKMRV